MQVKVTLTLKDEELKKIMDKTGLTKPDEIKGYFYAREKSNIECDFGNRYDIDVKVDDIGEGLRRRLDGRTAAQLYIYDELFNHKDPAGEPGEPGVKEVKRHAKVGEWIKISEEPNKASSEYYNKGDILKVYKKTDYFRGGVYCELNEKVPVHGDLINDNGNIIIWDSEYVVLENYKPEVKEVKRHANFGEWIKITNANMTFGQYKNGDILKVNVQKNIRFRGVYVTEFEFPGITDDEYVVLENYEPEEGEKK